MCVFVWGGGGGVFGGLFVLMQLFSKKFNAADSDNDPPESHQL